MGYLLLFPNPGVGTKYFEGQDKVAHTVLFFVWSFLVYMIRSRSVKFDVKAFMVVIAAATGLALLTEWIQGYMPNRSSDVVDFIYDLFGTVLGVIFGFFGKKELIRAEKKFDK